MNSTEQAIAEMLTENTGRHFLDSGGAYGRHWERNQARSFDSEPRATLEISTYRSYKGTQEADISVTLNVFHWLASRLEYCEELTEKFWDFCNSEELAEAGWLQCMEEYVGQLAETDESVAGIYGEGEPVTVNTYNNEDLLSQVIQYIYWTSESGSFVLLQIHGGCDVRGGYTQPRIFEVDENCHELGIFDNARADIYCDNEDCKDEYGQTNHWSTDDGCHWYPNGTCGRGHVQLEEYEVESEGNDDERTEGTIWIDSDNNAHCPLCGKGKLHADFY